MPARPLAIVPLLPLLTPFAGAFTAPTFPHVLVLVAGTLLASGRRTVAAALRAVGLAEERRFTTYHRVLNRGGWSALVRSGAQPVVAGPARADPAGARGPTRAGGGRDAGAPPRAPARVDGALPRRGALPAGAGR